MAASRMLPCFSSDDELLAEFDALSDNDTSNSETESQSESEGGAEEICDNFDSDSHQDASAQHTEGRRTAGPSLQWQRGFCSKNP
jgi:hypothetical protein